MLDNWKFLIGLLSGASTVALAVICIVTGSELALAAPLPSAVKGLVVTTPNVKPAEAKTFATQNDKILLSEYLEASRPGEENEQMLRKKFERAQRAWLSGNVEEARAEFRALSELSLKADWRDEQRDVLQTAYLRLAQSSDSGTEREGWLESAARLFGDRKPLESVFPPPLLNEYHATLDRLQSSATDIDLSDVFTEFRYVIVDGRTIDVPLTPHLRLMSGLHRLTAYSDSHESITEFLTAAQLRVLRLAPPLLVGGVCESAALRSRTEFPSHVAVDIYSGENCPAKVAGLLKTSRFLSEPSEPLFPAAPEAKASSHTWLWVVGAAVLAGAGYALASQAQSSSAAPQTTHRSGF